MRFGMPVIVAVPLLSGLVVSVAAQGAAEGASSKLAARAAVRGAQFRSVSSPQGRFTVSIPVGWELKGFAPDESSIGFTPKGEAYPEVSIALTEASTTASQAGLPPQHYGTDDPAALNLRGRHLLEQ